MNVITGFKFIGGFIGSDCDTEKWIFEKVQKWVRCIHKIASVVKEYPHSAHAVFTKSLQHEWGYILRVVSGAELYFNPLREVIHNHFLPTLTSLDLNSDEKELMCKPVRHVGMGIEDPVFNAPIAFERSQLSTKMLTEAIKMGQSINLTEYENDIIAKKNQAQVLKDTQTLQEVQDILQRFPCDQKSSIQRKLHSKCSSWLTIVPTNDNGFSMSSNQFRDAISLRYGKQPTNLPSICDADGESFTVCHALNCKKGGLVTFRHNELRDLNIELVKSAGFTQTVKEPIVKETDKNGEGGLRADWSVRGFWEHQREALFDCRIFNADAISYVNIPITTLLENQRNEKKKQYNNAVEDRRGTFTPFIATCDAILDVEAEHYI